MFHVKHVGDLQQTPVSVVELVETTLCGLASFDHRVRPPLVELVETTLCDLDKLDQRRGLVDLVVCQACPANLIFPLVELVETTLGDLDRFDQRWERSGFT